MRYKIKEFEFDSASLVLTKNSETISIRHNEAKVLVLLLESADKVLSKEDILSHVWQGKMVSEQAVFQNISHLRNLFGSDAIKTFSKRGYQWQLSIEKINDTLSSTEIVANELQIADELVREISFPVKTTGISYWPYALIIVFLVIMISFVQWQSSTSEENIASKINLAYIPIIHTNSKASLTLLDNNNFDFTELNHIDSATFITSAELEYPNFAKLHPFILTGKIRSHQKKVYLDFILKGPYADWQGQLLANSNEEITQQLQQHLSQTFIYPLLSTPQSPDFTKSRLSIAHQQNPQDHIILGQLINIYIETKEFDKAMALSEKLATNARAQDNWLQLGNALLYQSTILTRKDLFQLSTEKLTLAIESFEMINDLSKQADAWYAQSWLDHHINDYAAVKTSLLRSAQLAIEVTDKPREIDALTYLSIMAYKHKQADDKYLYLRLAENKMKAYKLPIYHFAKVPFHYAIFAKTPQDKEPHLKQVLEFTKLTPNHWVAQSSRKQLVLYYIKQERLQEAQTLVDSVSTDNAQNSYLKTLLAKESKQVEKFIVYAQRTFEQAQLAGQQTLSLDVALLLCSTPNIDVNYDFYSLYIDENASAHWRQSNKMKLLAINQ